MGNFVITGIQGCGKGTQARLLADEYGLSHISVGAVLRGHIRNGTRLGETVKELVAAGQLVPDEIVNLVVKSRLEETDCERGFILDGYPRDTAQAEFLLENFPIDAVINIVIPDAIVLDRILARRICTACGRDFNLLYLPPAREGVCDDCGGAVVAREDDTAAAIAERLAAFHAKTEPLMHMFREHGLLTNVDGTGTVDEVQAEIRQKLGLEVG